MFPVILSTFAAIFTIAALFGYFLKKSAVFITTFAILGAILTGAAARIVYADWITVVFLLVFLGGGWFVVLIAKVACDTLFNPPTSDIAKYVLWVIGCILIGLVLLSTFMNSVRNYNDATPAEAPAAEAPEQTQPSPEPTLEQAAPSFTPQPAPTAIPATPTLIPTATPVVPTAAPRDFSGYPSCLEVTEKVHPDSGEALINISDPYPGVNLEVEIYSTQNCVFELEDGSYAIMADWYHGDYDPNGMIINACPTGADCEGVSVLFRTDIIPAFTIVHLYIHPNGADAVTSFLGSKNVPDERGEWEPGVSSSFACRYLKYSQQYGAHDNTNIRVPEWAKDAASIFFHTGCADFDGVPGYDNQMPSDSHACAAPNNDTTNWGWYQQGGFWYHEGTTISFFVPEGISKVLYRNTADGYANKVSMTGENVSGATYAYAYCK